MCGVKEWMAQGKGGFDIPGVGVWLKCEKSNLGVGCFGFWFPEGGLLGFFVMFWKLREESSASPR